MQSLMRIVALSAFVACAMPAQAQDHNFPTPGGAIVNGDVDMSLNAQGQAVPDSAAAPHPVTCVSGCSGGGGAVTLPTTPTIAAGNGVVETPSSESSAGLAPVPSTALEANHIIKGSAGNLYSFNVSADSTLSAAAWWLMIYNATSAPADGAVTPTKCYAFPAGTTSYSAAFMLPVNFSTGITMGVSTTGCFSKTASAHAFISGDAK